MHTTTAILVTPTRREHRYIRARTVGWIALGIMILSGSTNASFGKQIGETFSPLSMLFLSELCLLLFSLLSFGIVPIWEKLCSMRRSLLLPLITAGTINGILGPVLWFTGLQRTSAVNTELFGMTEMLFLMIFGVFIIHQSLRRSHWIGGMIILLGIITVALRGFTDGLELQSGDLSIILACICYAVGGTIIGKYLRSLPPQIIIVTRSLTALTFFFLLSPFITRSFLSEVSQFPVELIFALLSYGFISRFLLVFSYYEAIEHLPIATVSLLSTLTVAGGALFAHFYLGETVAWYQTLGAAIIIAGAMVVQWQNLSRIEGKVMNFVRAHHR
ncbi:MAG: DMT family transporter [Candidatus Peregrinibacteria bacterium]